jgi:hypothetical protein
MIGWLADFIQLVTSTESIWKGIALVLLALFGYQVFRELKKVRTELAQASMALIDGDKPIDLQHLVVEIDKRTPLFSTLAKQIQALQDKLDSCYEGRERCMTLQDQFHKEPWRDCAKFGDCPAVVAKNEHVKRIEGLIKDHLIVADQDRKLIAEQIKIIHDLELENRKIIASFTEKFGAAVIKAVLDKGGTYQERR